MINPERTGRNELRVIKRPRDRYTYMTKQRDKLQQAISITRNAA